MTAGVRDTEKLNPPYNLTDAFVWVSTGIKFFNKQFMETVICQTENISN